MYEIAFKKLGLSSTPTGDADAPAEEYINECCNGGDIVIARVLPALREGGARVEHGQEDWGWFAWSYHGTRRLAVHVQCDAVETGEMRALVWVYERGPWWALWREREIDGPALDALRDLVLEALEGWADGPCVVDHHVPHGRPG